MNTRKTKNLRSSNTKTGERKPSTAESIMDINKSSLTGLSPDFMRKNDKMIEETNRVLSERIVANRVETTNTDSNVDQTKSFLDVISKSIAMKNEIRSINNGGSLIGKPGTSGSYGIGGINNHKETQVEQSVVEQLSNMVDDHFALMSEFKNIRQIIPEINKSIAMIARDVINRDEMSNTFIHNFYTDPDKDDVAVEENAIKELLNEYGIEEKVFGWIKTAETTGVKPIAVFPTNDVLEMVNANLRDRKEKGKSFESVTELLNPIESLLIPSPLEATHEAYDALMSGKISTESEDYAITLESVNSQYDDFIDGCISHEILDSWEALCMEEFGDTYRAHKLTALREDRGDEYIKSLESTYDDIVNMTQNPKHQIEREINLKSHLRDIISIVDRSIEVVADQKVGTYQATKQLRNGKYRKKETPDGEIEDFFGAKSSKDNIDDNVLKFGSFELEVNDDEVDIDGYNNSVSAKRPIMVEYNSEHVIPVIISGTHVAYYGMEAERCADRSRMIKDNRGSFTDLIKSIGYRDDKNMISSNNIDGDSPFKSDIFGGGIALTESQVYGTSDSSESKSSRRMELIKNIMMHTISKRLDDKDIMDNGNFQSAIFNFIKDDMLMRNKVRFSYIPKTHMVYMARELNDDGMPVSILDGTLFHNYMYITSLVSSMMSKVMKSTDTEIMEINIGQSMELGLSAGEIAKNASSRDVSASQLFSGTAAIMNNVGQQKRIIIPVVDDTRLFNMEQIARVNDVEIDDEFTKQNLKSVILGMDVPPTSLDLLDRDEPVASQTQHNLDYRDVIVNRGFTYGKSLTKLIRLIVHYSDLNINAGEGEKDSNNIKVRNINFQFSPPKNLMTNKMYEEIGNIGDLAEQIVAMNYGDIAKDNDEWEVLLMLTKKLLMRKYTSSTEWSVVDDILKEARILTPGTLADLNKFNLELVPATGPREDGDSDW